MNYQKNPVQISFGLQGHNIQLPVKLNLKGFIKQKEKQFIAQEDAHHHPLIIQPKSLNDFAGTSVERQPRISYSSRHHYNLNKRFSEEHQKSQKVISKFGENREQLMKKRVDTHLDFKNRNRFNLKAKKCACGDCEECLRDFKYFLHLFSTDQSVPPITAKSWCIWRKGKNQKFLHQYGKRVHNIREIASLTKLITAMVTIDFILKHGYDPNKITYEVKKSSLNIGGTTAKLKIGEVYTVTDFLYGLLLPSGNDAAICLSELIGQLYNIRQRDKHCDPHSERWYQNFSNENFAKNSNTFVNLMNEKCQKLGLMNTRLYNSHGNDAFDQLKNVSTCNQVAKMSVQFMSKYDLLKQIVSHREYSVIRYNKVWQNTNKLLEDGFDGIKTGITQTAGPCLTACYKDIIIVVLNSKSMNQRWIQVKKLVRWIIRKSV